MSSPKRYTLRLSRQAERDVESILQYTYKTYGEQQMHIYAAALHEALEAIANSPGIGHRRPDLSNVTRLFTSSIILWSIQCPARL
jgi:plasmid stabilization system protein ParE